MDYQHVPVMLKEVCHYLDPRPGQKFIDCTLGGAGYTLALAEKVGEAGKILAIDLDPLAIKNAGEKIKTRKLKNILLVQDNFKNLDKIIAANFSQTMKFDGLVMDLGLSSAQLDDETRGFSFKGDRPLDMAFGEVAAKSTWEIVNSYPLLELTRIFRDYGEEPRAYQIAKAIVNSRRETRIRTTGDLSLIVQKCFPPRFHNKINPATKIFQALRMETNQELASLEKVLPLAVKLLKKNGHLVVVAFHSGEDRIVKRFFRSADDLQILTKRPLIPQEAELAVNYRARSAKLRAAQKI